VELAKPSPSGGGIYNEEIMQVSNSTLNSNTASTGNGGGIASTSQIVLISDTLAGNSAGNQGGGFYNAATGSSVYVSVLCNTITANSAQSGGGGIFSVPNSCTLNVQNTIVAGNSCTAANSGPDINGFLNGGVTYNLVGIGDSTLSGINNGAHGNQVGTTANPINPMLAPLGFYGGPTSTCALLVGSPAIDTGCPDDVNLPDQRGVARAGGVNIGAYQATANHFVFTHLPASVSVGQWFSFTLVAEDQFGQTAVGYTGTVTFSSSDFFAARPGPQTFVLASGGQITLNNLTRMWSSGVQTLTATDSATGDTGSVSLTVN
jgi:hypothetical protein